MVYIDRKRWETWGKGYKGKQGIQDYKGNTGKRLSDKKGNEGVIS